MLSAACKDAIRAMVYIVNYKKEGYVPIQEISKELNLSFFFLSKILQKLVKAGFLESHRGPKGGVKLAKRPSEISLLDIVEAIDGDTFFTECILGFKECSDTEPCAIHEKWAEKREQIYRMFKKTNFEDIERKLEKNINIKL
jgi:Rrf2 family protein